MTDAIIMIIIIVVVVVVIIKLLLCPAPGQHALGDALHEGPEPRPARFSTEGSDSSPTYSSAGVSQTTHIRCKRSHFMGNPVRMRVAYF